MLRLPRLVTVPLVALCVLLLLPQTAMAGTLALVPPPGRLASADPIGPARTFYGEWRTIKNDTYVADFSTLKPTEWFKVSCTAQISWAVTESVSTPGSIGSQKLRIKKGSCFSPLGEIWGPASKVKSSKLKVTGYLPDGGICGFTGDGHSNTDGDGVYGISFSGAKGFFNGDLDENVIGSNRSCTPKEWSIETAWSVRFGPDKSTFFSGDIGPLPKPTVTPAAPVVDPSTTCSYGTPSKATFTKTPGTGSFAGYSSNRKVQIDTTSPITASNEWRFVVVMKTAAGAIGTKPVAAATVQNLPAGASYTFAYDGGASTYVKDDQPQPVGVQVWRLAANAPSGSTQGYSASANWGYLAGQNVLNKGYGDTKPGICTFYLGEKVFDDGNASSSVDDPYAPPTTTVDPNLTDTEPPTAAEPTESPCKFVASDPSSWLTGSMCAVAGLLGMIVGVLGDLLRIVTGLPAAIVVALGDLIQQLVIPEEPLDVRMSRMKLQTDNKAPFSWAVSAHNLPDSIPGGGGCPNWRIKVGDVDKNIICGTPFGNAIRGARPVFLALMLGAAFWPMIRSVLYASFPVVKPAPVSS